MGICTDVYRWFNFIYSCRTPERVEFFPPSPATDTRPLPLLPPNETRFDGLVYEEELLSGGKEKRGLGGGKKFF